MNVVIIGGGAAGFEAAIQIRRQDSGCGIVLLSEENVLPYRRPALTRLLTGEVPDVQFYQKNRDFYVENRIELHLDCRVLSIDRVEKRVESSCGEFRYDKLLLAVGASARTLRVPGCELPNVFKGRSRADFDKIEEYIQTRRVSTVAIIGGGLLGLEFAEGLLKRNMKVSVIEYSSAIMPNQLDCASAEMFERIMEERENLTACYGARIKEIKSDGILLDCGSFFDSDMIIWSMGAIPNTALAAACGITTDSGIVVDSTLVTSDPDIYAAGDCAEIDGVITGLWSPAKEQGAIAAANICGESRQYRLKVAPARFSGFSTRLYSAGIFKGDGVVLEHHENEENFTSETLAYRDGKLSGVVLLGDISAALKLESGLNPPL